MNKYNGLLIILCFLGACKQKSILGPTYTGEACASKNQDTWSAKTFAYGNKLVDNKFDIFFDMSIKKLLRGTLYVYKLPYQKGIYNLREIDPRSNQLTPGAAYYTSQDDGGIAEDSYFLDTNRVSTLTITKFNANNNQIKGTFEIYLKIDSVKLNSQNPDTLSFLNGEFSVKIE